MYTVMCSWELERRLTRIRFLLSLKRLRRIRPGINIGTNSKRQI